MGTLAHLLAFFWMLHEIVHGIDCGPNITNRNQDARVLALEDIPRSWNVACDGDYPACHALDHNFSKSFCTGQKEKDFVLAKQGR